MISIASPDIGDEEIKAVNEVLFSGMLAQGPKVTELEEAFAKYCGTKFAVAVNSGTAAIHASLYAAGVGEGDEVITTPFSFIATINPILLLRGRPVLVDIDPQTFNLDVDKIEAVITPRTKAILPVDLYGQPADYEEIWRLAKKYRLTVIEDACQAIGATYKTKKTGNLGDLGCFSLYATKNIMSGEGGIVTTNNEEFATLIKQFRQHGMSAQYEYVDVGYNYRMTDLLAAIAVEQLKKVDKFNKTRQKNAAFLTDLLQDVQGIQLPKIKYGHTHVFHQYTIRVTTSCKISRDELLTKLKERGIGAAVYYPKGLHQYSHIARLGYKIGDFPQAEQAAKEVLSLPIHPKVTDEDLKVIANSIKELTNGH